MKCNIAQKTFWFPTGECHISIGKATGTPHRLQDLCSFEPQKGSKPMRSSALYLALEPRDDRRPIMQPP
jgi:hypothetical protein